MERRGYNKPPSYYEYDDHRYGNRHPRRENSHHNHQNHQHYRNGHPPPHDGYVNGNHDYRQRKRDRRGYSNEYDTNEERSSKRLRRDHEKNEQNYENNKQSQEETKKTHSDGKSSRNNDKKDNGKQSDQNKDQSEKEKMDKKKRLELWRKRKQMLNKLSKEGSTPSQAATTSNFKLSIDANKKSNASNNFSDQLFISNDTTNDKPEDKNFSFSLDPKSIETKDINQEEDENNEDIDPLDAYMNEINKSAKNLDGFEERKASKTKVITMDEIFGNNEDDETDEKNIGMDIDDSEYKKQFLEELKKGKQIKSKPMNSEDKKKNETVFFSDEEDEIEDRDPFQSMLTIDTSKQTKNKKDLKPVDHSKIKYHSFRKNFYLPPKEIKNMTLEEIEALRLSLDNVKVRGKDVPAPIREWNHCGLNDLCLDTIENQEYKKPFPIQAQSIPAIMSGRDMIGIAKTGSGKTLAFLLPMIRHVMDQPPLKDGDGPIGLVVAPTRELALQIYNEVIKFSKSCMLRAVCVYGGAPIAEQIAALKRGAHIVVCTPGRMIDLLCANKGRVTNLMRVTYVVLDEADRMFDLGFGPQITRIIENIRPDKQILLFSATFPKPLEALAKKILQKPVEIVVGGRSIACESVEQHVEVFNDDKSKFLRLLELLGEWHKKSLILIFVDKQEEAGNLNMDLISSGYPSLCLHGGMDQSDRESFLKSFKAKEKRILIATSVAARGLDVKDLNLVINYNVPNHYEDYVHRVGRTGRAGRKGTAYTFVSLGEERYSPLLVEALKQSKQPVPENLLKLAEMFKSKKDKGLVSNYPTTMSGFGGSGYKFDEKEQNKKKEEMLRQAKSMGLAEELGVEEEEDIPDEDFDILDRTTLPTLSSEDKTTTNDEETTKDKPDPSQTTLHKVANAQAFAALLSANKKANSLKALKNDEFQCEVEINDYPQVARWKVINKDAIYDINEKFGVSITVKGVHVDTNSNQALPLGERKLYLLMEATSKEALERARMNIMYTLEQATKISLQRQSSNTRVGKYKVL